MKSFHMNELTSNINVLTNIIKLIQNYDRGPGY